MKRIFSFIKNQKIIILIILIGIFFRTYHLEQLFVFEHDQDLLSFIIKDILSGHIRMIGQLTSIDGLFIGPLYYYFLAPFYWLFNYNPLASYVSTILVSICSIVSIYYVFSKLFNTKAGTFGALTYSISFSLGMIDKWVVPTQLIILWSIWMIFLLFSLLRKDSKKFYLSGVLLGTIWHIYIGLIAVSPLILLALWLGKVKLNKKQIFLSVFLFSVFMLPYFLFEVRHGFSQTLSLIQPLVVDRGTIKGIERLIVSLDGVSIALTKFALYNAALPFALTYPIFFVLTYFLKIKKALSKNEAIILFGFLFLVSFSQFITKRQISDYYFNSCIIISLLLISVFLSLKFPKIIHAVLFLVFVVYFISNFFLLLTVVLNNAYQQKKQIVNYIKKDYVKNNYPCAGVDYIASFGSGVGFRYLLWYNRIHTVVPNEKVPVYKILIPEDLYQEESKTTFGILGIVTPPLKPYNFTVCEDRKYKEPPLLGYTD